MSPTSLPPSNALRRWLFAAGLVLIAATGLSAWIALARLEALDPAIAANRLETILKVIVIGGTLASLAVLVLLFNVMRGEARWREAGKSELRRINEVLVADAESRLAELTSAGDALKMKDEDLVRTRAFLKLVIEHVPGMLFIKDAKENRFVLVNRGAEEMLGFDRRELIGKTDHEVFPPEQADRFVARDRRVLTTGRAETIEDEMVATRSHSVRHLRTHIVPVADEQGRAQFLLGFSEDITDRRHVEQQFRQAQKMEAIGQLTGGVAHDFNNLLMVILGNLELLEAALEKQPALLRLVRTAARGADRGAALVKSLLAFARKQPLEPVPVDLNKLLRETVEMLNRTLGDNIAVEVVARPGLWQCEVDLGQLQSALLNLAINARDAMPSGGTLTIETDCAELDEPAARQAEVRPGQFVILAVSDTGTGISPEILERVFDPFFTTKEPGKGSGLGLSMVYGVVKQSRGHVRIYSEVGVGTTVRIYTAARGEPRRQGERSGGRDRARPTARDDPGGRGRRRGARADHDHARRLGLSGGVDRLDRGGAHHGYRAAAGAVADRCDAAGRQRPRARRCGAAQGAESKSAVHVGPRR